MVSVTPLWGVNDKMSLQRYGGSLLLGNASSLIMGEWPHLRLAGIMRWTKIDVTLVHCLLYGRGYNRDYQLPPYPEVVHLWDDHRNMERFFIFYFYLFIYLFIVIVVLGVPLPILISPWWRGTHRGHVSYFDRLKGLISGETFQLSCAFRDKPF